MRLQGQYPRTAAFSSICSLAATTTQARDTIRVDYYLNGKGADEKRAELSGTRQRAKEQMETYYSTQTQRRGQMLV